MQVADEKLIILHGHKKQIRRRHPFEEVRYTLTPKTLSDLQSQMGLRGHLFADAVLVVIQSWQTDKLAPKQEDYCTVPLNRNQ